MKRVFLDMDGVLSDFIGGVLDLFEMPNAVWPDGVKDMTKVIGQDKVDVWNKISNTPGFWANLKKTPECDNIIETVKKYYANENIFILTSPSLDPKCLEEKYRWISNNLPRFFRRQYLMGPPKYLCANRDSTLIDDHETNCNDFRNHGGHAFLFPRRWNIRSSQEHEAIDVMEAHIVNILED